MGEEGARAQPGCIDGASRRSLGNTRCNCYRYEGEGAPFCAFLRILHLRMWILIERVVNKSVIAALVVAALTLPFPRAAPAQTLYDIVTCDNGIEAHVYSPETILGALTERDDEGRLIFKLPNGDRYLFIEDTSDPAIINKGDGSFHPMSVEEVLRALDMIDVQGRRIDCEITVYILPYPRYGILRSTASGNTIFLSPGVYEASTYFVAYTVTHEFGHVFQNTYLPESGADRWETYLRIRGIYGNPVYTDASLHCSRPREIFAEDFRYLFGGEEACYTHSIENPDLPLPDAVEGLEDLIVSVLSPIVASMPEHGAPHRGAIVSAANFPNPFNPSTTIEVTLNETAGAAPRDVEISIYRVDGSLVRTLYSGEAVGAVLRSTWNGRDARGADAPSGVYFYRVRSGSEFRTGKMLLIR